MAERTRFFRRALTAALVFTLLAACGGGSKKQASSSSPATSSGTTTTAPPPVWPLTGLPVTDATHLKRPALVVKIDNADSPGNSARPQSGLNQADVVFEEMVEGSVTRLAAVFHSNDAALVGPVRSARTTDVAVFSPLNHPLFAWSGANADFADIIRSSPIIDVGVNAQPDAYERRNENGHVAPHNLYTSTGALYAVAPSDAAAPPPLFKFRAAGQPLGAGARPVNAVHLEFGSGPGNAPVDWAWQPTTGRFIRGQRGTPDTDDAGEQLSFTNVIVQFVTYHDTGYVDPVGTPVPEGDLVGSGPCWILSAGQVVDCSWTKTGPDSPTTYADAAGQPIGLLPGTTWVELPPPGGGTLG